MKKTVPTVGLADASDAVALLDLPEEIVLAMTDIAGAAREGLLAMSVAAGLAVMAAMLGMSRIAWVEWFNARLRDELLNAWRFDSLLLLEVQVIIEGWRIDCNTNRPHTAHGDLTPSEYALQWTTTHQPQAA